MDVVQFGRWISERRRKRGWSSQRALADTARHDPILADCKISEDFLARLEAGRLAHPFRGNARKQVLALAWLLCKTPRDVKVYLNVAELAELSADEAEQVERLREYLMIRRTPAVLLLSARPSRLVGHAQALHELTSTLCTMETGLCAITGMPGVGKSALAHEALHVLASNDRMHVFPDGIVTFSCTKRHGEQGLIALLQEISAIFSQQPAGTAKIKRGTPSKSVSKKAGDAALPESQGLQSVAVASETQLSTQHTTNVELADAIDHARIALMDKSVLILLDDLDARFPLRRALEALLGHSQHATSGCGERGLGRVRRVVLTTGCYVPPTALVAHRIQLEPLKPEAALELFASLTRVSLTRISAQDRAAMEQICAAVGYLPLAIEVAANAITIKGIPLSLLAAQVGNGPLDHLLDGDGVLRSTLDRALANFTPELRKQFSLLTTLEVTTFGLECAATILGKRSNGETHQFRPATLPPLLRASAPTTSSSYSHKTLYRTPESDEIVYNNHHEEIDDGTVGDIVDLPVSLLANTAATLGLFVGHSLLELIAVPAINCSFTSGTRYRLHPLLYAYAQALVEQMDLQEVYAARRNAQSYAEAYLECFQGDTTKLEREQKFLLAMLNRSWQQEQFTQVIRFVARLSCIIGRLDDYEKGELLLRRGIYACRKVQDRYHLACFLNRLGALLCSKGELAQAQQFWQESLEIAGVLNYPAHLWQPLVGLAHLAHIRGEYAIARQYVETYLRHARDAGDIRSIAAALLKCGFYARLEGDVDDAYDDVSASLSVLSKLRANSSPAERILEQEAQIEMARVQGDYICSQEGTEAAVALARHTSDFYAIADLLWDQAEFAYQQRKFADARVLAQRVIDIAHRIGASHFRSQGMALLQRLSRECLPQQT